MQVDIGMSIHGTHDETNRTAPHRRVERIMDKMRIAYQSEIEFPPYCVDIYCPEWHLAIEIDGPQHSARRDEIRDNVLREKYFLPVLRIKTLDKLSAIEVIERIENFIIEWAKTGEERKSQWIAGT